MAAMSIFAELNEMSKKGKKWLPGCVCASVRRKETRKTKSNAIFASIQVVYSVVLTFRLFVRQKEKKMGSRRLSVHKVCRLSICNVDFHSFRSINLHIFFFFVFALDLFPFRMMRLNTRKSFIFISFPSIWSVNQFEFSNLICRSHIRDEFTTGNNNVYCVQFNNFLGPMEPMIFASVAGHRVSVYECKPIGAIELLQCYGDPDVSD